MVLLPVRRLWVLLLQLLLKRIKLNLEVGSLGSEAALAILLLSLRRQNFTTKSLPLYPKNRRKKNLKLLLLLEQQVSLLLLFKMIKPTHKTKIFRHQCWLKMRVFRIISRKRKAAASGPTLVFLQQRTHPKKNPRLRLLQYLSQSPKSQHQL